ncbi:smad nuclear interacting protein 1 [Amanita rubescens]|nr:smad nuclear interacting protein 1 [Amanita rubescens]
MPRDSRPPPRHRERPEKERSYEQSARHHDEHRSSRSRYEDDSRSKYTDGDTRSNMERTQFRRDERRRDYDYPGGYGERERERERQRDRERYDRERDRGRSASPRRSRSGRSRSASPDASEKNKAKPNFAPSGLLAAETNTIRATNGESTVLKYNEPPEARRPTVGWRLYVFKGEEQVDLLHINRQSAYLIGRDRLVADIVIDHPSCSKQHAVIQLLTAQVDRFVHEKNELGDTRGVIKPYVIDLESTNGTHVNGVTIPPSRFYELKQSDVIKFGTSAREYVLLHDEAV